jgi:hypothetical protein
MTRKKRKFKLKRKAWVEPEMMESGAFRSLAGTAMWILLRFQQKQTWSRMKSGGRNINIYENSGLTFTYSEAEHFDISNAQFYRSIKKLVERGFLDVEHRGGSMGIGVDYTRFKLSNRWRQWGTDTKKPGPGFQEGKFQRLMPRGLDIKSRQDFKESLDD